MLNVNKILRKSGSVTDHWMTKNNSDCNYYCSFGYLRRKTCKQQQQKTKKLRFYRMNMPLNTSKVTRNQDINN